MFAPYFSKQFDTYEQALDYQAKSLLWCIENLHAIRAATLDCDKDFDTKKIKWWVVVRAYPLPVELINDDN